MNPPSAENAASEIRRTSPLDATVLANIRNLNPAGYPTLLGRLVKAYLTSSAEAITAFDAALAKGDREALGKTAHSLKSSSGNMGATQLADLCKELELVGRSKSDADPTPLVEAITHECGAVCKALQTELAKATGVTP